MKKTNWIVIAIVAVVVVVIAIIVWPKKSAPNVSSTGGAKKTASLGVILTSKAGLGNFLADEKGMTLYYYPKDNIGKSNCSGGCAVAWPIFYSENLTVTAPLSKQDFTTVIRSDGSEQSAYKGWPLYYYKNDLNPGDTLGEGVGNIWYIMPEPFYSVMAQNQESTGTYLASPRGQAIYSFTQDKQGAATAAPVSNCSGQCLANWPMVPASGIITPSLFKKTDFTALNRPDGAKQLVYKGWPLYYYAGDKNPGDLNGQGLNNAWFAVKP